MTDFELNNHGSIAILHANSAEAQAWVEEFLPEDRQSWGVNGTVIEPRYVDDILAAIQRDGLTIG